ncbi:metallophosphoesterase family protein [Sphingobacterium sp. LRF_L2]|uniref:metallophosphoesterase family protein n=1 Tax=Sphingobacterium sp. LRF_L2 TaxID=3369421 RepID=UPI003F60C5EE
MYRSKILLAIVLCFTAIVYAACKRNFQYSVLEVKPLTNDLNLKAIDKVAMMEARDTFSFLVISDTQIAYDELQDFVKHANDLSTDSIAFILHGGDYTDYGANFEFNLYYDEIKKLKFPVIGTIGNHDMLGNGREIFRKYFGSEEFSFNFGKTTFISFNSNSREVGFDGSIPNTNWIQEELNKFADQKNIVFLSHIAPRDSDFDQTKTKELTTIMSQAPNSRLSIHGHTHSFDFGEFFNDGLSYVVAPTLLKRAYVKVTVRDKKIEVNEVLY